MGINCEKGILPSLDILPTKRDSVSARVLMSQPDIYGKSRANASLAVQISSAIVGKYR